MAGGGTGGREFSRKYDSIDWNQYCSPLPHVETMHTYRFLRVAFLAWPGTINPGIVLLAWHYFSLRRNKAFEAYIVECHMYYFTFWGELCTRLRKYPALQACFTIQDTPDPYPCFTNKGRVPSPWACNKACVVSARKLRITAISCTFLHQTRDVCVHISIWQVKKQNFNFAIRHFKNN